MTEIFPDSHLHVFKAGQLVFIEPHFVCSPVEQLLNLLFVPGACLLTTYRTLFIHYQCQHKILRSPGVLVQAFCFPRQEQLEKKGVTRGWGLQVPYSLAHRYLASHQSESLLALRLVLSLLPPYKDTSQLAALDLFAALACTCMAISNPVIQSLDTITGNNG